MLSKQVFLHCFSCMQVHHLGKRVDEFMDLCAYVRWDLIFVGDNLEHDGSIAIEVK